jgi:hypothetical protein
MSTAICDHYECKNTARYTCAKCKHANYCCEACQLSDWKDWHRRHCIEWEKNEDGIELRIPKKKKTNRPEKNAEEDVKSLMMQYTSGRIRCNPHNIPKEN